MKFLIEEVGRIQTFVKPIRYLNPTELPRHQTVVFWEDDKHVYTAHKYEKTMVLGIRTVTGKLVAEALYHLEKAENADKNRCSLTVNHFDTYDGTLFTIAFYKAVREMGTLRKTDEQEVFYSLYQKLRLLQENEAFLAEEERHLVKETIPNDMKRFIAAFSRVSERKEKEASAFRKEVFEEWESQMDALMDAVEGRQLQDVELITKVVQQRNREKKSE